MSIDEFIKRSNIYWLYHFTDVKNLPTIRKHGLLSYRELQRRGIHPPRPGGNDWSHERDADLGLSGFVHLCFMSQHPMEYQATKEGRIGPTTYLKISPEILRTAGVCGCTTVSNKKNSVILPIEKLLDRLDMKAMFDTPIEVVLADPDLRERYNQAKKAEILVPDCISTNLILTL